jgi:hypothetical protein
VHLVKWCRNSNIKKLSIYFYIILYIVIFSWVALNQYNIADQFYQKTGDIEIYERSRSATFFLVFFVNFPASLTAGFCLAALFYNNLIQRWFWMFPIAFFISLLWFFIIQYLLKVQ